MKMNVKLFIGLGCLSLGLTACTDDYFDQEAYDNLVKQAFPVADIDPNHTWKMYGTATVNVNVNNDNGETYRVKVYKEDPRLNSALTQLAQSTASAGSSTQLKVTYDLSTTTIYVVLYDKNNVRSIKSVDVSDGATVTADFFSSSAGSRIAKSQEAPEVLDIPQPYDEAWVASYLTTAKEPDNQNIGDNYDNSTYSINYGTGGVNDIDWNNPEQNAERNYFFSLSFDQQIAYALEHHPTWINYTKDETYVTNFKITGTWNGGISVAGSEGSQTPGSERTIVVTGTWNITANQKIGSLGKIIIANGGTVNVASGVTLSMVNQARLVVLYGGKLTGAGKVEVSNGNAVGEENYNGGLIDVAVFNNNFGKFYNHGRFLVNEYWGGAQESNFYNHTLASIDHFGSYDSSTANARIFNACQFYVTNDARIRNYEGTSNSALIVGGQLMFSSSADGTTTPTYVSLASHALVQAGTLYNNGTSWTGPTSGDYAVLSVGQIVYLNWEQDHPELGGYFINNIYVKADDWTNAPDGNGMGGENAKDKFAKVANKGGNGNLQVIYDGDTEIIPTDPDYTPGNSGCSPGFSGKVEENVTTPCWRFCFEDNFPSPGDYDFNDCVISVEEPQIDGHVVTFKLWLDATGATKQIAAALRIKGLSPGNVVNVDCSDNLDDGYVFTPTIKATDIYGSNAFVVDANDLYTDAANDFVLRLFSDAHYSLGKGYGSSGAVSRIFYNTVDKNNTEYTSRAEVDPREMEFTFVMNSGLSENQLKSIFSIDNFDIFILESHGSIKWEVHTVPFKFDQVLNDWAGINKYNSYVGSATANYPWALCLPGEFKYPNEWYSISGKRVIEGETYGYTDAAYPQFHLWAESQGSYTDWWKEVNATEELIYK